MIVVEGPDGAGKTTLTAEICKRYDLREAVLEAPSREKMNEHTKERAFKAIADAIYSATPPRVYDRVYFSELVYGPIWRNKCEFNDHEQKHIQEVMRVIDCPVIFCLPKYPTVVKNINNSEQMEKVAPHVDHLYGSYTRQSREFTGNSYTYDYELTDIDYFLQMAVEPYLEARRKRTWR